MYRLAKMHSVTDRQADRQTTVSCQEPIILRAVAYDRLKTVVV